VAGGVGGTRAGGDGERHFQCSSLLNRGKHNTGKEGWDYHTVERVCGEGGGGTNSI
jgi:hypothetical protein